MRISDLDSVQSGYPHFFHNDGWFSKSRQGLNMGSSK
jgi:hypothetical protein